MTETKIPFAEYFFSVVNDQRIKKASTYRYGKIWVEESVECNYLYMRKVNRDSWMVQETITGPRLSRFNEEYEDFFYIELTKDQRKRLRETVKSFKRKVKKYKNHESEKIKQAIDDAQWHP